MKRMRVAIGADHAAVALKDALVKELRGANLPVEDLGTHTTDSVDYPDFAREVAARVAAGTADRGILLCGTGIGMSIAANKVQGIRAAVCHDVTTARLARLHNDANVLCMGGRLIGLTLASDIMQTWLATQFEGGRHKGRVEKIHALETLEPSKAASKGTAR